MAELKTYKTPGAFKAALAERLRSRARSDGIPTDRARLELIRKSGHSRRGRLPHVQAP